MAREQLNLVWFGLIQVLAIQIKVKACQIVILWFGPKQGSWSYLKGCILKIKTNKIGFVEFGQVKL